MTLKRIRRTPDIEDSGWRQMIKNEEETVKGSGVMFGCSGAEIQFALNYWSKMSQKGGRHRLVAMRDSEKCRARRIWEETRISLSLVKHVAVINGAMDLWW